MDQQNDPGFLIRKIHTILEKNSNNSLKESGLTVSQIGILIALENTPENKMTLKELEKAINLAQSTTAGIVSRLVQKGLVNCYVDEYDKRSKLVEITPLGKEYCETAHWHMNKANENLVAGLTDIEKDMFISILKKVSETMK